MRINRMAVLTLFDARPDYTEQNGATFGSHISAISGLIGEDLILGLLSHYWARNRQNNDGTLSFVSYKCCAAQGRRRLDAWFKLTPPSGANLPVELFKIEVKNWSFHSFGMGRHLAHDADQDLTIAAAEANWLTCINDGDNRKVIEKVKAPMTLPSGFAENTGQRPVLCFWAPLSKGGGEVPTPFFKIEDHRHWLSGVSVFSASLYLRSLTDEMIDIEMPRVEERLRLLQNIGIKL